MIGKRTNVLGTLSWPASFITGLLKYSSKTMKKIRFGAVNKVRQLFYLVRDINSPIHQSTFFYWNIYSFIVLSELKSSKLFEIFRGHQNAFHSNLLLSGLPMNSRWIQNNYDSWNLDDIWCNRMNLSGLYDAVFISLSATYSLSKICNKYEKNWWRLMCFQPSFSTLLEDLADLAVLKNSTILLKSILK